MLANFFGKSKPVNFVVLFTLFLCYFLMVTFSNGFSLDSLKELFWFIVIFSVFNFIIAKNNLTFDNSYAFLFYVLLIGSFSEVIQLNNTFYANITSLLFLRKVYSLKSSKNTLHKLFDGGLWLGISFLIEPLTACFAILLYASIYLHQRFTYQTLLTPIIGFFPPLFLYFTYCFWYDKMELFTQLFKWKDQLNFDFYLSNKYLIPIILIGVLMIFSLLMKTPKTLSIKNTFRKSWILVLIHLACSVFIVGLINERQVSELQFLFFPTAIVLTNGIELIERKWLVDVLLIVFVTLSFVSFFL
ncbi:hypothetical protein WH52_13605 [Tenacibaculum holothuriorum]|uniref:Beta-carotene 15,15'-monooxygenase n=1 Tax=Tenacibaculum holothuriorum TaxID=1635173 RepID=A0A1Y2P9H4_9FLAO|nr:DUF6427 family protein [Tenacibaculum holothuriorum]OSY87092.1 hypothetical protein WH52_13605 [Tenacibaculum holothuriorum]